MKINSQDIGIVNISADTLLANALNTVYLVCGILAIIVIIVAGYFYVTSSGNATNVEKAKNAIISAVIGLIIVLLAFVITNFLTGRFS